MNDRFDWQPDLSLPAAKSTRQHFAASAGADRFEIDVAPWGEADLSVNGRPMAHVAEQPSAGDAFRNLDRIAEDWEATKEAQQERAEEERFLTALENDEVRENLKLLHARASQRKPNLGIDKD
jgi:hypothetical protein